MSKRTDRFLAEILLKSALLDMRQLAAYQERAEAAQEPLYDYLLKNGILNEKQILTVLAATLNLPIIDLKNRSVDATVIERIPVKFAWYYQFIPLKIEGKVLTLATALPLDVKVQDEIRVHLGLELEIVLATQSDCLEAIKKHYGLASETIDRMLAKEGLPRGEPSSDMRDRVEDLERKWEDPSVTRLVNQIILEAYRKRATDIHIEPYRKKVRVRYRIDGVLIDANLPPEIRHFLLPMISRIKIMSNLSITERRLPQDGSIVVQTRDQVLDLRVSTIPTPRGESMVIRILPTKVTLLSLENLGFSHEDVHHFRELLKRPHGIIFMTGPTGSGKTTTLYACLNEINAPYRKIITIEDPIEYEMEGITQVQINPKVGFDFARGLRSVLRHDPDILMVGEVRDLETAEIAIRTALTGHLVFSTLHTNDAASGITRLMDMGIEPFLVASSVEAYVAQRLVRMICTECKEIDPQSLPGLKEEISRGLNWKEARAIEIYRGKGCDRCNYTGYYGRTAIYEILSLNDSLRAAILEKPRSDYIKRRAILEGMVTLRQNGWRKVLEGITTPSEVMHVTTKDSLPEGMKQPLFAFMEEVSQAIASSP